MTNSATVTIPEGYKQTEVGVIPEDWFVHKLGEVGQTIIGLTYSPNDVSDYGTLVLRSSNVQRNRLAFDNNVFVNMELSERVIVRENDILICVRNGSKKLIGKCALIDKKTAGVAFGAFMSIYRSEHNGLIFFQFQADNIQNQINEVMGATINQITNKDMASFIVPLPSDKQEQTAIANALSDVDKLIAALETLIAKKSAIKTAAMQQLLTGKKRLPGFAKQNTNTEQTAQTTQALQTDKNSDVANSSSSQTATRLGYKHTELGEVPEDWSCVPLGQIANIKTGSKNNQDNETDGVYPFYVRSENVQRLNTFSYDCEAILIPGEGGIGSIFHYINGKFDAHQRVYVIRQFTGSVGKFVYYQIRQRFGEHAMKNSVKATVDSLRLPTLQEFMIFLPSIEEQTAISNVFSDMDTEIDALQQRLSKTKKIKHGMMQELLTGNTRLV